MSNTWKKLCQRRLYDLLSSRGSLTLLIVSGFLLLVSILHFGEVVIQWSTERYHALGPPFAMRDNLAGRSYLGELCSPFPIDLVYTWVNGSDPRMMEDLRRLKIIEAEEEARAALASTVAVNATLNVTSKPPMLTCNWRHCYLWKDYRLIRCKRPPPTQLREDVVFVEKRNSSYTILVTPANYTIHLHPSCTSSIVFVTPDERSKTKLQLPGGLWITGKPFEEKKSDRGQNFVEQLGVILQHTLTRDANHKVGLFYFHDGCMLLCQPPCNESILQMTLGTFASLSLKRSPVYLVWNDTGPAHALNDSSYEDSASRSRYEDNDELRYSLRSVSLYAPWIRRIYLVTNGQVPSWLRLDHPRLHVITHKEIFSDSSHLPTFNSAAIEMHLHRIPGLSRFFIYMNDDVFFGGPVLPEDFYTNGRGHRVYLTWAVPNCRPGCPNNWLHDGYCDKACNHPECDFDAGDCGDDGKTPNNHGPYAVAANAWANAMRAQNNPAIQPMRANFQASHMFHAFCHGSCADAWLGDGSCDSPCNRVECAFDSGDCGDVNFDQLCVARVVNETSEVPGKQIEMPPGVSEFIVDFSPRWPNQTWDWGRFWSSSPQTVRSMTLAKKYGLVVVLLYRNLNSTQLLLSVGKGNVTAQVYLSVATAVNGTCPQKQMYRPKIPQMESASFPTMKPYPKNLREPKPLNLTLDLQKIPKHLSIDELESRISAQVDGNQSQQSQILLKNQKELERKWSNGMLTNEGYRYFMWTLLTGSSIRVTADYRRETRTSPYMSSTPRRGRHLLDMFGDSLRFSNQLFSRTYGYQARKVPGHMPHFMDRTIIGEVENRFDREWKKTSKHRFRNPKDLQFAFTYYYFLMSEKVNRTIAQWLSQFDIDHSLSLSKLEIRSLALKLWGLPFVEEKLNSLIFNCTGNNVTNNDIDLFILTLQNCPSLETLAKPHLTNDTRFKFEVTGENDIWFKMLNANLSRTEHHLDEIRSGRRKFMCLNDDIDHAGNPGEAAKVRNEMRNLLLTMYPRPSQFELSESHSFLHIDVWRRHVSWKRSQRTLQLLLIISLVAAAVLLICRHRCLHWMLRPIGFLRRRLCRRGNPCPITV